MPNSNQNNSFKKCRKELLNYKFDEVLDFYREDFGDEIADDIENKTVSEIGEENPDYDNLLEQKIIRLWYELDNKVIDRLNKGLTELPNTIGSSDIIIKLENIRKKIENNSNSFKILKKIYVTDIYKMKFQVKSRLDTAKNVDRIILSKPLMVQLDSINKISYKEKIGTFKNKCNTTTNDIYSIITETLHSLWVEEYSKEDAYRRFEIYKDFEKILFKDPRYRDHFIHQFQVFLSGLPIIDAHYESINSIYSNVLDVDSRFKIEFSWLLSSTFHDIGYLVQQYDKWLDSFFKEFLDISNLPINLDLGKLLLARNFQDYIDKLTSLYFAIYGNKKGWRYSDAHGINHEFRKMLTSKLINERNHGIISSLILLDRIENSVIAHENPSYMDDTFSSRVMPAALAISLHDKSILLDKNVKEIDFTKDPLSFILIYCDTIQDWGRPISPDFKIIDIDTPCLSNLEISESRVSTTLTYNKIKTIDSFGKTTFDLKEDEIKKILGKLKSKDINFEITLQSLDPANNIPERTYKSLR